MRLSAVITAVACRKINNDVTIETDLYVMNPTWKSELLSLIAPHESK